MANIHDPTTWPEWGQIDDELKQIMSTDKPGFAKTPDINSVVPTRDSWYPKYQVFAGKALDATNGSVSCEEIQIPRRDGGAQRALVYKPTAKPTIGRPLLILIHGGGFCYGCPEMEGPTCISAAQSYGCVAMSLSYRLAPEHKFPTATNDCWDALEWVSENLDTLGVDASKGFILGGTSAGGNIALVLSHLARDKRLTPSLTGLYLNVPLVLAPETVPEKYLSLYRSRDQNSMAPVLNTAFMDMYTEAYAPDLHSYVWSPINWPGGDRSHSELPRTYFQICGLDILRDEGLIYERIIRQDYGTETKVDIYPGLPHMFVPNYPGHSMSKVYPRDTLAGLGWLFRL